MATITYYVNGYALSNWTNPTNAVDGSTSTYANTTVNNRVQQSDSNTCPGTNLGTITAVEFRIYAAAVSGSPFVQTLTRFNGVDGDSDDYYPSSSPAWSSYYDATSDTNAPGTWSWSDVVTFDVWPRAKTTGDELRLYMIEIRVTYTEIITGSAALSGTGALSTIASLLISGVSALSGAGALSADALAVVLGDAALSGAGTLSADSLVTVLGDAAFSGVGALSADALAVVLSDAALTGTGTLSADALAVVLSDAALSGIGTLLASGDIATGTILGAAVLSGVGGLSADALAVVLSDAALTGTGTLSADALAVVLSDAALSGIGNMILFIAIAAAASRKLIVSVENRQTIINGQTRLYNTSSQSRTYEA